MQMTREEYDKASAWDVLASIDMRRCDPHTVTAAHDRFVPGRGRID